MKKSVIILIVALSAFAVADVESIEGLKGIREVAVIIDAFNPEQIRQGLNPIEISERIAETLKGYNITPISADKLPDTPHTPALWLNISTSFVGDIVAVSFELSVRQDVQLVRNEKIVVTKAVTWSRKAIGVMQPKSLPKGVEIKIKDFLRSFIEDHHEVNGLPNPFKEKGLDA